MNVTGENSVSNGEGGDNLHAFCHRRQLHVVLSCFFVCRTRLCGSPVSNQTNEETTMLHDDFAGVRVVPEREACALIGVGFMTWQRMKARGETPPVTQLSPRRVGYRVSDLAKWLDGRRRDAAAEDAQ
jgi:predicted DNA-binding transcriptional regulator AlpA